MSEETCEPTVDYKNSPLHWLAPLADYGDKEAEAEIVRRLKNLKATNQN